MRLPGPLWCIPPYLHSQQDVQRWRGLGVLSVIGQEVCFGWKWYVLFAFCQNFTVTSYWIRDYDYQVNCHCLFCCCFLRKFFLAGVRKIHYKLSDGKEMVEEYSMSTDVLQRRMWKVFDPFRGEKWDVELGDPLAQLESVDSIGIKENSTTVSSLTNCSPLHL